MSKQVHLAVYYPAVENAVVWRDPRAGSQIEFSSFAHVAQTAERGKFDFFFLAEGLRLREVNGHIHDLDVMGRPESLSVLAAVAAVTSRIGVAATLNATFNEPYEIARRFASLDWLSGGRAGWNVVTSSDSFYGANFRRGGFLDYADRYTRAGEFIEVCRKLWDSWAEPELTPTDSAIARTVDHDGRHFTIAGQTDVPRPPQGHPVIIQAGDSPDGRDFGASVADVIFSRHGSLTAGQEFYRDVKGRLAKFGRQPSDLKIMPSSMFVLGDTEDEARSNAHDIRMLQVSPLIALQELSLVWGQDMSWVDPDGPLPDVEPVLVADISAGRVKMGDQMDVVRRWRQLADDRKLTVREVVAEVTKRNAFIGTPGSVAEQIDAYVQADAADGFVITPSLNPGGLDEFVERVVPELQERGVYRPEYQGRTLRDHLGLRPAALPGHP